jgi:hypothetical protein
MIEHIPPEDQPKRSPGLYEAKRLCRVCRCVLSQNNPHERCAPCQLAAMPTAELIAESLDSKDITLKPDWAA